MKQEEGSAACRINKDWTERIVRRCKSCSRNWLELGWPRW